MEKPPRLTSTTHRYDMNYHLLSTLRQPVISYVCHRFGPLIGPYQQTDTTLYYFLWQFSIFSAVFRSCTSVTADIWRYFHYQLLFPIWLWSNYFHNTCHHDLVIWIIPLFTFLPVPYSHTQTHTHTMVARHILKSHFATQRNALKGRKCWNQ